jgi:hypothetical protein
VDEPSGRLLDPLRNAHREAHVRETSSSQIGQSAGRAVEFFGQLCPREFTLTAALIERCVYLT